MKPVSQAAVLRWLADRGWKPFAFQREVWSAMKQGRSGLLHANTGTGKTLAAWLGALQAVEVDTPNTPSKRAVARPTAAALASGSAAAVAPRTTRAGAKDSTS